MELGYRRESAVSVPGDFAVRGGIVDVFGVDRARPWRAEWFGDDVEDLRVFDPATQESISKLEAAQVWPARELDLTSESVARALASVAELDDAALRDDVREQWESDCDLLQAGVYEEGLDLFFPYLGGDPPSTLLDHLDNPIVLLDGGRERLIAAAERHAEEIENLRVQEEERGELPHGAATGLIDIEVLMQALDALPGVRAGARGASGREARGGSGLARGRQLRRPLRRFRSRGDPRARGPRLRARRVAAAPSRRGARRRAWRRHRGRERFRGSIDTACPAARSSSRRPT